MLILDQIFNLISEYNPLRMECINKD